MSVARLPPLSALAVELVASLFRYTTGDVVEGFEDAPVFKVDLVRFRDKLLKFADRAEKTGARYFNLLGGIFVGKFCGVGKAQELARKVAEDPKALIAHVSHVEMSVSGNVARIKWGYPPYIDPTFSPPVVASVEFVEGARTWPAIQLVAHGRGKRKRVEGGYERWVEVSCYVLGAIALGLGATYVSGSQREGRLRLLIPLTLVEYDVGQSFRAFLEGVNCGLPEHLMRLIAASYGERPAVYKYIELAYKGEKEVEKDSSYELVLDTASLRGASLILRDYRSALKELSARWCECDRRGWEGDLCREVEQAAEAYRSLYLFLEAGYPDEAYKALSRGRGMRQLASVRDALFEIVERVV